MNIKELQEELVGKIALIPTENDRASVKNPSYGLAKAIKLRNRRLF